MSMDCQAIYLVQELPMVQSSLGTWFKLLETVRYSFKRDKLLLFISHFIQHVYV